MLTITQHPDAACWTSSIPTIKIETDAASVSITLTIGTAEVFSNSYVPANGICSIVGLSGVVETYMRGAKETFSSCKIQAEAGSETDTAEFIAIYCQRSMKATFTEWQPRRFASVAEFYAVDNDQDLTLWFFADASDTKYTITGVATDSDGNRVPFTLSQDLSSTPEDGFALCSVPCSPAEVLSLANSDSTTLFAEVQAYNVAVGSRNMTVFVRRPGRASECGFRFRNVFNLLETVRVCGVLNRSLDIDRGEAVSEDKNIVYRVTAQRDYELSSAPVSVAEARFLEQLVESFDVSDADGNAIVLTDSEFEYSNDYTAIRSVKLSWRYADRRVVDETVLPKSSSVFSDEYDYRFS